MRQVIGDYIENELLSGTKLESDDQELLVSGLVDSLGVMKLISFIGKELDIRVPPADVKLRNFATINAIVDYLETKRTP